MAKKEMIEGNIAMAEAALRGGCRFFAGYPITPQSPFLEYLSWRMEEVGGEYVQAESEVASSNMIMGASGAGARACTATAGMGLSLMMEALSWTTAGEYPAVVVHLQRGGAGASGGGPSQTDYNYVTKTLGHGGLPPYVLAPSSVQEAADMLYDAFDFADKYRCVVFILTDAMVGQVMEPVEFKPFKTEFPVKPWAVSADLKDRKSNIINPIADMNQYGPPSNRRFEARYKKWEKEEVQYEEYFMKDAETVLIAYGTAARIARGAIDNLREEGKKVGMFRPITLVPFPVYHIRTFDTEKIKNILVSEIAVPAQFYLDVERANLNRIPLHLFDRSWGEIFTTEEIETELRKLL